MRLRIAGLQETLTNQEKGSKAQILELKADVQALTDKLANAERGLQEEKDLADATRQELEARVMSAEKKFQQYSKRNEELIEKNRSLETFFLTSKHRPAVLANHPQNKGDLR